MRIVEFVTDDDEPGSPVGGLIRRGCTRRLIAGKAAGGGAGSRPLQSDAAAIRLHSRPSDGCAMASPLAFISDELWDFAAARAAPEDFTDSIAEDCEAVEVSADDLSRAPVVGLPDERPVLPDPDPARVLAEATGPVRVRGVLWPVVEGRLAVLVFLNGRGQGYYPLIEDGTLDSRVTDATAEENGQTHSEALEDWSELLDKFRRRRHSGEGVALFRCSLSGRVFGTYALP